MLKLTEYSERHKDGMVMILNNENIAKWLIGPPFPYSEEDALQYIKSCSKKNGTDHSFAVEYEDEFAGGISLHLKNDFSAVTGYYLDEKHWNKGIMTEILTRVADYAFNALNLKRISAYVFEDNIASERLLIKCGFENEGYLRKSHRKGDKYFNTKLFSKVI